MRVGVGYSDNPNTARAAREALEKAIVMSERTDLCSAALLFCTARHNQKILRNTIIGTLGAEVPIYGGGSVGVITNDEYGYAGYQVGVACLWLDDTECEVFCDSGLMDGEHQTGRRIGEHLAKLGAVATSPVMMIYDAVKRNMDSSTGLTMATPILEGIEESLGFLPDINGAGLMSDFTLKSSYQFVGKDVNCNSAIAVTFGSDIRIDTVVMHGCKPASTYFTVTKAEGPVILEIDGHPALEFVEEYFDHEVSPEQFPFFLLFGVNSGERWGKYQEEQYASRLCLDIDRERGGIVMFEPDMVAGTEFQVMMRSLTLDYIKPKVEKLFTDLDGREPVFALYFDCVGRSAGYNGIDVEDAPAIQEAIANRVPLLGLYSGVEIAKVGGRSRGLDLTGVLCLISQGNAKSSTKKQSQIAPIQVETCESVAEAPVEWLSQLAQQNASKLFALDAQALALRYELELKRRGFSLLSELAVSLKRNDEYVDIFRHVASRINAALNMQKTIVLRLDDANTLSPVVLQGFEAPDEDRLIGHSVHIAEPLNGILPSIYKNGEQALYKLRNSSEELGVNHIIEAMQEDNEYSSTKSRLSIEFELPYFLCAPINIDGETIGLLLTGRLVEEQPYYTALSGFDLETVMAISELLGAVLIRKRLHEVTTAAETDGLTRLWNRGTFKHLVEEYIDPSAQTSGAFMMIDVDFFKSVNDNFGHIVGDELLKNCAQAMQSVLRTTDFIGRQGGDEFVVFCPGIKNVETAKMRAKQINEVWQSLSVESCEKVISASIGIAMYPEHGTSFEELYKNADSALYVAKASGRNCHMVYQPQVN